MSGGKAEAISKMKVQEILGRLQAVGTMLGQKNAEVALLSECIGSFVTANQAVIDRFVGAAAVAMKMNLVENDPADEEVAKAVLRTVKLTDTPVTGDAKLDAYLCEVADVLHKFTRRATDEEKIEQPPKESEVDGSTIEEVANGSSEPVQDEDGPRSRTVFATPEQGSSPAE